MDEPRDRLPEDQSPDASDSASTPAPSAPVERRDFFRRSVELAALSLFGVGAVDPLLDRVIARVAERHGADRLTTAIAQRLAESGVLTPRAHAARSTPDCPSDYGLAAPDQLCDPDDPVLCEPEVGCPGGFGQICVPGAISCPETQVPPFACRANTMPPFAGCRFTDPNPFKCEWGEKFHCDIGSGPAQFDCDDTGNPPTHIGFSCPPWAAGVGWFDCVRGFLGSEFDCDAQVPPFDCAGTAGTTNPGFLCPSASEFYTGCPGSENWQCGDNANEFTEECTASNDTCSGATQFTCSGTTHYFCGRERGEASGTFTCGADKPFLCGGNARYDFVCRSKAFTCGGGGVGAFTCDTKHIFQCDTYVNHGTAFECAGTEFRCSTGGTRCNYPGTGDYRPCSPYHEPPFHEDTVPGDFLCWGERPEAFKCSNTAFRCAGLADDFRCLDREQLGMFTCDASFGGCQPTVKGRFVCNNVNGEFACVPAHECPADKFATEPSPY